ncbi:hypothetical protein DE146DRAFT_294772 [Phaeosphaeria sp. MPI-PUGE-AT-0046c]|nr:hypothetical protein DE146DRAFT_294772 [Phaeosphaeria sp. MPI-PUGE-AT-0046c]
MAVSALREHCMHSIYLHKLTKFNYSLYQGYVPALHIHCTDILHLRPDNSHNVLTSSSLVERSPQPPGRRHRPTHFLHLLHQIQKILNRSLLITVANRTMPQRPSPSYATCRPNRSYTTYMSHSVHAWRPTQHATRTHTAARHTRWHTAAAQYVVVEAVIQIIVKVVVRAGHHAWAGGHAPTTKATTTTSTATVSASASAFTTAATGSATVRVASASEHRVATGRFFCCWCGTSTELCCAMR